LPVSIQNPPPGGSEYCTIRRAHAFVFHGRAEWIAYEKSIRFRSRAEEQSHAAANAARAARAEAEATHDREVHRRIATLDQMRGLPMVAPERMIAPSARAEWAWRKAVWRRHAR
jgi:hypothetical protein